jgi:thiamine kinase-like enzyme
LQPLFEAEAARLAATHRCLVHGDFSPKNILISRDRLVLLDCEVAWFGDPVFDIAFLLNHLMLKSIHLPLRAAELKAMLAAAWRAYLDELTAQQRQGLEPLTARLMLMLMLARVDGKSPVEYLGQEQRAWVRAFVARKLERLPGSVGELVGV